MAIFVWLGVNKMVNYFDVYGRLFNSVSNSIGVWLGKEKVYKDMRG